MTTNTEQKTPVLPEAGHGNTSTGAANQANTKTVEKTDHERIEDIAKVLREHENVLVNEWKALFEAVIETVKTVSAKKPVQPSAEQPASPNATSPESAGSTTGSTGNSATGTQGLFDACRTRLQEVDAKKVAAPIVEAAGKTIVISLGVGFALTALCIKAVVDAAKEAGAQDEVQVPAQAAPEASTSKGTESTSTEAE